MGLLGNFFALPQQPDQFNSLLGMDPRQARWNAIGSVLQGAGVGLATGDWGKGLEASQAAQQQAQRQALLGYQMKQDQAEQDWQNKSRARQQQEWDAEDANSQKVQAMLGSITDPQERMYAQLNPEAYVKAKLNPGGEGGGYYGVPIPYALPGGGVGYGLPSKAGGFAPLQAPNGGTFLSPYEVNQQKGAGSAVGAQQGAAAAALPGAVIDAQSTIDKIDALAANPNLGDAVGYGSALGDMFTSNEVLDIRRQVNELKGSAFMTAYSALKGGGQITEVEGQQAKAAIADMDTAMKASDPVLFKKALTTFRDAVSRGVQKLQAQAGPYAPQGVPQAGQNTPPASTPASPPASGYSEGDTFGDAADIPEGATVVDDSGVAYQKINGQLVKRQ